jgi:peptidylprolyl isomerase
MVQAVPRGEFPKGIEPKVGQMMRIGTPDGKMFIVRIMEVSEAEVTLDGNHPLAGKELTFDIELLEIV